MHTKKCWVISLTQLLGCLYITSEAKGQIVVCSTHRLYINIIYNIILNNLWFSLYYECIVCYGLYITSEAKGQIVVCSAHRLYINLIYNIILNNLGSACCEGIVCYCRYSYITSEAKGQMVVCSAHRLYINIIYNNIIKYNLWFSFRKYTH